MPLRSSRTLIVHPQARQLVLFFYCRDIRLCLMIVGFAEKTSMCHVSRETSIRPEGTCRRAKLNSDSLLLK